MKKILFIVSSMLISLPLSAANVWHSARISSVYPQADGSVILLFDVDSSYCTHTGSPKYYNVVVGQNSVTAQGAQNIYSAALSAAALNKPVNFVFDDNTSSCYINRLSVHY